MDDGKVLMDEWGLELADAGLGGEVVLWYNGYKYACCDGEADGCEPEEYGLEGVWGETHMSIVNHRGDTGGSIAA